jgi:hypothetical protein
VRLLRDWHQGAQGGIDGPVAAPVRPGFVVARAVGQTIAVRFGLVQRAACARGGAAVMLSPCLSRGRLFCRLAVLGQRLFELLFDAEGVGGGARSSRPRPPGPFVPSRNQNQQQDGPRGRRARTRA